MFDPEKPPELEVAQWLNCTEPPTLAGERGKVVVVALVQIVCPGSAKHGLPQAMRIRHIFEREQVSVFALHMAFQNIEEQTPEKIESFLNEKGILLPVAIDKPDGANRPKTMAAYELRGTPGLLIFDRQGRLRRHYLGGVDDLRLGAEIMAMLIEEENSPRAFSVMLESKLASVLANTEEQSKAEDDECGCGHNHDQNSGCGHDHHH